MNIVEDRFMAGFVGGAVAGVVMAAINLVNVFIIRFATVPYYQWAAGILYGRDAKSFAEISLAQLTQLGFAGGLGVLYTYLVTATALMNYRIKGLFYGWASWFILYALAVIFELPTIHKVPFSTAISNFVTTGLYGWILAEIVRWIDRLNEDGCEEAEEI